MSAESSATSSDREQHAKRSRDQLEPTQPKSTTKEPSFQTSDMELFKMLVQRANTGDKQAIEQLRETLDNNPQVWQRVGDLAAHAELTLIRAIAGKDKLLMESIMRKAEEMRASLAANSPLEKLVVERVVATWLQLQYVDSACASRADSFKHQRFWADQQHRAHCRYMAAIKQLTAVRFLLPSNAGEKVPETQKEIAVRQDARSNGHVEVSAGSDQPTNGNGKHTVDKSEPKRLNGHGFHNRISHLVAVPACGNGA